MHTVEEILRKKKIKVTPQRMAVYSILKKSKFHPSVEMIYQKLKPDYPAMSLATVYKTVDILKKVGLIQELNVGDGGLRYDAQVKPHSHIYCKKCGKVVDVNHFPGELQDSLLKKIEEETGFDILFVQLYFFGTCPECNNNKKLLKASS
ncbi:MAG TPA: transcriptional repressor [Firmicutes bacterium]|jgi:Fur family peroxide stress response transcriptional regulator|nr:transcriptional repressor [Bacillota bacterium]